MSNIESYSTSQEEFWAGNFGTHYINRNNHVELLASNLNFFQSFKSSWKSFIIY